MRMNAASENAASSLRPSCSPYPDLGHLISNFQIQAEFKIGQQIGENSRSPPFRSFRSASCRNFRLDVAAKSPHTF